ncbi:hypothetical protein NA57DRAFT_33191 [Rhizodiscina lignyota]|uniref:Cytochrome b5 heme-binding domain-containing protein n=1 Tax=Rhizodiscina lignyota TaxID=1504668 RepID=A0A9P4IIT6_9PEZI|nr:hypothetical protein NA57DRAFT_33191 [Rhizodiscina lignyota]
MPPSSPASTPKAKAANGPPISVPTFTLEEDDSKSSHSEDDIDELPPPSFPAMNSAQRASAPSTLQQRLPLGPAALANGNKLIDTKLMPPPPPPRLPQPNRHPPTISNSLRVPSTGPLPNRGPPTNSLAPPPSAATQIPNPRKRVLLSPGHSPLDWANLQRTSANLSGVNSLQRVTPSLLKQYNGRKGRPVWASYQGKVYNLTPYVPYHPGGEGEIRRAAGKDGEKLFMEVHPWVNWENMLGECLVGIMVGEIDTREATHSSLEDMD